MGWSVVLLAMSSFSAKKTTTKKLPWKLILAGFILLLTGVITVFLVSRGVSWYQKVMVGPQDQTEEPAQPEEEKQTIYNILLTGYGGFGHDGSYLTDTLMLANIDMEQKKVMLISVPRDLWVRYPSQDPDETSYAKINSVYQAGLFPDNYPGIPEKYQGEDNAPALIKDTIEEITGLEVDYFVGIDFSGFRKAIDALGGIEVDVERAFDDYFYPVSGMEDDLCGREPKPTLTEDQQREQRERYEAMSPEEKEAWDNRPVEELSETEFQKIATEEPQLAFPCRYEHIHYDAGLQEMDGDTALKFARSRKSLQDGGDFNRAARQQKVIEAVKERVLSVGFIPKIIPTFDTLSDHVRTDIPLDQMRMFLGEAPNADQYQIDNFVLTADELLMLDVSADGQSILVPAAGIDDYSEIQQTIQNVIAGITPTPTPDPSQATPSGTLQEEDTSEQADGE